MATLLLPNKAKYAKNQTLKEFSRGKLWLDVRTALAQGKDVQKDRGGGGPFAAYTISII